MAKYLLVVADDFSACQEIDDGVLKAVKAGNVDCVDCFVTFDRSQEAIHHFKHFRAAEEIASGKLKMGLHVTLTTGSPIATNLSEKFRNTVTSSNGEFKEITKLPIDRLWKHYSEDVKKELRAQYDRFVHIFGAPPQHISCHEGIFHLSKELTTIYLDFIQEKNLLVRNPKLISTIGKPLEKWKDGGATEMVKRAQLNALIIAANVGLDAAFMLTWSIGKHGLKQELERRRNKGLLSAHYCVDHFYGTGNLDTMQFIYERMDDGKEYEMITHPVWYEKFDDFNTPSGINKPSFYNRKQETTTLTSPLFAQLREQHGIQRFVWP